MDTGTIDRFVIFGKRICGEDRGWKKIFADELHIRPQQLNNILVGNVRLGPKMQSRLRELGADVDFILTGRTRASLIAHLEYVKMRSSELSKIANLSATLQKMARDNPQKFQITINKIQAIVDKVK